MPKNKGAESGEVGGTTAMAIGKSIKVVAVFEIHSTDGCRDP